jgi:hypothetical protein
MFKIGGRQPGFGRVRRPGNVPALVRRPKDSAQPRGRRKWQNTTSKKKLSGELYQVGRPRAGMRRANNIQRKAVPPFRGPQVKSLFLERSIFEASGLFPGIRTRDTLPQLRNSLNHRAKAHGKYTCFACLCPPWLATKKIIPARKHTSPKKSRRWG